MYDWEPLKAQNDDSVSIVSDVSLTSQENNLDYVDQSLQTNVIDDTFSEAFDSDVIDKENNRDHDELHLSEHEEVSNSSDTESDHNNEDSVEPLISTDPGQWPPTLTRNVIVTLVLRGPSEIKDIKFPQDENNRRFPS